MSTKKQATWVDGLVAESDLPSDDFTWTEGSNYGLDGFHYDQTLGEGTRSRGDLSGLSGDITSPQSTGMSGLPDGLFSSEVSGEMPGMVDDDGGLNLSAMLSEEEGGPFLGDAARKAASLADLAWLDPTQEQDPERLPKELRPDKPPLNSSPELEEAWGVQRRTDGLQLIPNKDKEIADYEQSIESGVPATPGVGKNAAEISTALQQALRLAHYGRPLSKIRTHLELSLGEGPLFRKAFAEIKRGYGLMGNVYVLARAFPGLKSGGELAEKVKKTCRTARYVVTDDPGVATKLGMKMVSRVPWKKALAHYAPWLKAAHFKIASTGNPKTDLQRAFLRGPKPPKPKTSHKPVETRPADKVSLAEARTVVKKTPKQARQVIARDGVDKARKKAQGTVYRAAKLGFISKKDAHRLFHSPASPEKIRQAAANLSRIGLAAKQSTYSGVGTQVTAHRQKLRDAEWARLAQAETDATLLKRAHEHLAKMVNAGQITVKEARRAAEEKTPKQVLKVATAFANSAGTRKIKMSSEPAAEYKGPIQKAALPSGPKSKKLSPQEEMYRQASKASGIKVAEFKALSSWLRKQMSEGMAGDDLTDLVRLRFAPPLREAASQIIDDLRAEHEGLSGHLYVDAAAYASPKGTKGCEKAASKHRANNIRYVRAMSRCTGCVFANANGTCTKYGKDLLQEIPKGAAEYQQRMIRMANAPDHENTAALFSPSEYSLSSPMTNISVDDPEITEDVGEVVFGDGMIF